MIYCCVQCSRWTHFDRRFVSQVEGGRFLLFSTVAGSGVGQYSAPCVWLFLQTYLACTAFSEIIRLIILVPKRVKEKTGREDTGFLSNKKVQGLHIGPCRQGNDFHRSRCNFVIVNFETWEQCKSGERIRERIATKLSLEATMNRSSNCHQGTSCNKTLQGFKLASAPHAPQKRGSKALKYMLT